MTKVEAGPAKKNISEAGPCGNTETLFRNMINVTFVTGRGGRAGGREKMWGGVWEARRQHTETVGSCLCTCLFITSTVRTVRTSSEIQVDSVALLMLCATY